MITQGELRNQIEYDKLTGLWRWRDPGSRRNRKRGWFPGSLTLNGYMTIRVDGTTYYAHQLAWLYEHGELLKFLDHQDRNKSNNCISNLRPANKSVNTVNSKTRSDSTSGHPGVSRHSNGRWHAYINKDGVRTSAYFATREEAIAWYQAKREEFYGAFVPQVVSTDSKRVG